VKLSLSEISTPSASFREDLAAYSAAGFDGIGIWEMKLGDDKEELQALEASSLRATNCVPLVPSILPNTVIEGTWDVDARIVSIMGSIDRFARYQPECVLCLTGARGGYAESKARRLVTEGLKRIAEVAGHMEVPLGLEPIHVSERENLSLITSIPEALDLLDEADLPQVGIMVDLWHLWDTPTIEQDLRDHVDRITGVHVSDWFADARDGRALPGEGVSRTRELVALLSESGWQGSLDVEIFGDAGDPDSLWSLPVDEAARRAYDAAVGVVP
jgi:sugar phosphate isomerase/epimerase